jgi:2-methylisocitrate lyase-like PEP mutase family enzyme
VDVETVRILAREIAGPVNVVIGLGGSGGVAPDLIAAGARRISVGGVIARTAMGLIRRCALELKERGTVSFAADQIPQAELNRFFESVA